MRARVWAATFLFGLAAIAADGQKMSQNQGQPMQGTAAPMSSTGINKPAALASPLKISFIGKSAEWTPATLAVLPHVTLTVYNEHAKANQTYSGVPLMALLTPLGVPEKPHGKEMRLYLVAEGSDGYEAVYSAAEVNPDVHDATVIVADTLDGKPLQEAGPFQLVATGEKRPARWVRNLVAVKVLTAD